MPRQKVALNIKNPEVHQAAARLARLQGTTLTQAVLRALREELRRQQRRRAPLSEVARMEAISRRVALLPILDARSEEEILGYGRAGYPDGN